MEERRILSVVVLVLGGGACPGRSQAQYARTDRNLSHGPKQISWLLRTIGGKKNSEGVAPSRIEYGYSRRRRFETFELHWTGLDI